MQNAILYRTSTKKNASNATVLEKKQEAEPPLE